MNAGSPQLMLVLGLPQSGGDRLRRCLELCGAPAIASAQLDSLHSESLASAGLDSLSVRSLSDRWFGSEPASEITHRLADALRPNVPESGLRVLQLYGQERVLPLWQSALAGSDLTIGYVLALRHPLEVAEALARANGCSRDRGLLIWLQSTLAMEAHTRDRDRFVLEQERLSWDPDGVLNQFEQHFRLQLPERSHERLLLWEQEEQAARNELMQQPTPLSPSAVEGSPLLQMALELHQWFLAEARGQSRRRLMPDVICQQLAWAEALYGRTLAEEQQQRRRVERDLSELNRSRLLRLRRWLRRDLFQAS